MYLHYAQALGGKNTWPFAQPRDASSRFWVTIWRAYITCADIDQPQKERKYNIASPMHCINALNSAQITQKCLTPRMRRLISPYSPINRFHGWLTVVRCREAFNKPCVLLYAWRINVVAWPANQWCQILHTSR